MNGISQQLSTDELYVIGLVELSPTRASYRQYGSQSVMVCAAWWLSRRRLADLEEPLPATGSVPVEEVNGPYLRT